MRRDHAAVATRRILQAIAQHIANDPALLAYITNLLNDEFDHVIRQTMNDLSVTNNEDQT